MSRKLGVVMAPGIEAIIPAKDSTLAILLAAAARGWTLHHLRPHDLSLTDADGKTQVVGRWRALSVEDRPSEWFELGEPGPMRPLAELDCVLMRADPPVNMSYIAATWLLEAAQRAGDTLVVNAPDSLRDLNEKLFATEFPQCCPPFLVSADAEALKAFHGRHRDVILKPLDRMGGQRVFRVGENAENINAILETLLEEGRPIMAQRRIPEISDGDKRVILVDGEPNSVMIARLPADGEARANLAAGGRPESRPLGERERWICSQLAPTLKARGLLLVGIDVIGDYLTEINITSPTGLREVAAAGDEDPAEVLIAAIEARLDG